jgi:hypothetical protein
MMLLLRRTLVLQQSRRHSLFRSFRSEAGLTEKFSATIKWLRQPMVLPKAQVSDTTDDDQRTKADNKKIL